MMYLNQSIIRLYQTYKNLLERDWVELLVQSINPLVVVYTSKPKGIRPSKKSLFKY